MNFEMVPYAPSSEIEVSQIPATMPDPGHINGVYIVLSPDYEGILHELSQWYVNRPEVRLADHGFSDKVGLGYIMIEWLECLPDQLLLDQLKSWQFILDFSAYQRDLEGGAL